MRAVSKGSLSHNHLSSEAEATLWGHHLFQDVALDAGSTDIFIDYTVLQVDVIYRHANQRQFTGEGKSSQQVVCTEQIQALS